MFLEEKDLRKETLSARRKLLANLLKRPPERTGSLMNSAAV